jgi:hypothetical protein
MARQTEAETFDDPFKSPEDIFYKIGNVHVQNDLYKDVTMAVTTLVSVGEVDMGLDVNQDFAVRECTEFDANGDIVRSRIE